MQRARVSKIFYLKPTQPLRQNCHLHVEAKLKKMGLVLPVPVNPKANYIGAFRRENTVFLSGHLPYKIPHFYNDDYMIRGKVGKDLTVEGAYEAAKSCALALLGTLKAEVDDLDMVQIMKISGFVNCVDGFTEHSKVINGASDFLIEVLGPERGRHCRIAIGCNSLPFNVAVEIEMVAHVLEQYDV